MRIIINATNLKQGGALQVTSSVLEQLKSFTEHEYHVFLSPQLSEQISVSNFPGNFTFHHFSSNPTSSVVNMLTFAGKLSKAEKNIQADFVLTVFGPALWKPKAPHLVGFANGLYLFNKARFLREVWLTTNSQRIRYDIRRFLLLNRIKHEATLLWTETEYSKKQLEKSLNIPGEDIFVIGNTYSELYESARLLPEKEKNGIYRFIYITADYPHKNLEVFNKILPLLKARDIKCSFYLTLPEEIFKSRFPEHVNNPQLINLGPLTAEQCYDAYQKADALFFPSFTETFSANYPEAMVMRKPIITSDLPYAHDICGDAALYFDPFEPDTIVYTIEQLINSNETQKTLIQNGLSILKKFDTAQERAEKLLKVLKDYLNRNS